GAVAFVLAPTLARLLLPVPAATECPRCRYALAGAGGGRCPECGLPVGEAYIASAVDPGERRRRARSRLLDEITPAVFLLGGLWSVILSGVIILSMTRSMGVAGFVMGAVISGPILLSHLLALRLGAGRAPAAAAASPPTSTPAAAASMAPPTSRPTSQPTTATTPTALPNATHANPPATPTTPILPQGG